MLAAQNTPAVDSLSALLRLSKPGVQQVELLNELAWELKSENPQQARSLLDSAILLSRQFKFKKGEGDALNYRGVLEDINKNYSTALSCFEQSLVIRKAIGDEKKVASLLNNMGNVKKSLGLTVEAYKDYKASMDIRLALRDTAALLRAQLSMANFLESIGEYKEALDYAYEYLEGVSPTGDTDAIAGAWNVIGNIKSEIEQLPEARQAYETALALHKKAGNDRGISNVSNNFANHLDSQAEKLMDKGVKHDSVQALFLKAIQLHQQNLELREQLNDLSAQAETYNNLGYILKNLGTWFMDSGKTEEARKCWTETENYFNKALEIWRAEENISEIIRVYNGISDVRRRQERFPEALDYAERYYQLAVDIDDQKFQQNGLKDLARIHYELGDFQKAYKYLKKYDDLREKRFNEEREKLYLRRDALYIDEVNKQKVALQKSQLEKAALVRNSLLGGGLLLSLLALVLVNRNKIIRREKQRSEDLLLNILPASTAEELKKHGRAKAMRYETATVLFTDFKSFTQIAEQTTPEALVAELDECFRAFDEITGRHGIEKIKTIGDAYLCVAGVPQPSPDHAVQVVGAAQEMQAFMLEFRQRQQERGAAPFHCRIGIHSGPLVAGVVGKRKFAYDIWGDTVNIAARMEQSGEPDHINISQHTYELVRHQFRCTYRGKVAAKNKGEADMYFVEGKT
ncbi:MAG: hypothetical protein RI973_1363 [Bacteroidota bacterium]